MRLILFLLLWPIIGWAKPMTLEEIKALPVMDTGYCSVEKVATKCLRLDHGTHYIFVLFIYRMNQHIAALAVRVNKEKPDEQEVVWKNPIFFPDA